MRRNFKCGLLKAKKNSKRPICSKTVNSSQSKNSLENEIIGERLIWTLHAKSIFYFVVRSFPENCIFLQV